MQLLLKSVVFGPQRRLPRQSSTLGILPLVCISLGLMGSAATQVLTDASILRGIGAFLLDVTHFVAEFKKREYAKHMLLVPRQQRASNGYRPWCLVRWGPRKASTLELWEVAVLCKSKQALEVLLELSKRGVCQGFGDLDLHQ